MLVSKINMKQRIIYDWRRVRKGATTDLATGEGDR